MVSRSPLVIMQPFSDSIHSCLTSTLTFWQPPILPFLTKNFITLQFFLYKSLPFYTVVEHNSSASQNTDLWYSSPELYYQFGSRNSFYFYCRVLIISSNNLYAPLKMSNQILLKMSNQILSFKRKFLKKIELHELFVYFDINLY